MASDSSKKVNEFPDVENKLQALTKKSVFERKKAEDEAKRLKEEAETKAVLEDFVKSFDEEDESGDAPGMVGGGGGARFGGFSGNGPPRRHFGGPGGGMDALNAPSGPGNGRGFGVNLSMGRGSGPGSLGPAPPSLNKKRTFEGFQQQNRRDDRGILAFDDYEEREPKRAFQTSDDEDEKGGRDRGEEKAIAKPTLRLASLPPGTSPAVIKALLPSSLVVDSVRILPPSGPGTGFERKSMSAIVTLAKDTPANEIDSTVNSLSNRYLGYGYYLNLHRHLSSAAISSSTAMPSLGSSTSQPFGAKPVSLPQAGRGQAPPPHHRGFAPPTSYAPTGPGQLPRSNQPLLHVPVHPPTSIGELRMIHKTIESLLVHGPEFEALLMSRASVQREERWSWIWDARSVGGIWYRWRLWEILTSSSAQKRGGGKYLPLFENSSAWKAPDASLAWEYTTHLDEFVSDSEYNSSDEDDSGDEGGAKRQQAGKGGPVDSSILVDEGKAYLNPLEKAKLTHLLARLPTSNARLRKGDVARITAFAISHAGRGADEIVSMIVSNVEKPYAYTSANPSHKSKSQRNSDDEDNDNEEAEETDTSGASLIGIFLISDILSSSSTSGVRHAWRYRQLFESSLKTQHSFEKLGRMERKMKWGRLRAEKWKRSVNNILSLWEGWCVFPQESQEHFMDLFNNPPLTTKEMQEKEKDEHEKEADKNRHKWKSVETPSTTKASGAQEVHDKENGEDVDGMAMDEDVDGEPMVDDDIDGVPMSDEDEEGENGDANADADGEPMAVDDPPSPQPAAPEAKATPPIDLHQTAEPTTGASTSALGARKARPRAVDMFADSSGSEDDNNSGKV